MRIRLHRWRPADLVTADIVLVKLLLGVFAIVRAEDYAHGAQDRFGVLEAAMPLWVWAIMCSLLTVHVTTGVEDRTAVYNTAKA